MVWAVGFIIRGLLAAAEAEAKPSGSTVGVGVSARMSPQGVYPEDPRPAHKSPGFSSGPD